MLRVDTIVFYSLFLVCVIACSPADGQEQEEKDEQVEQVELDEQVDASVVEGELYGAFRVTLVGPVETTPGDTTVFGMIFDGPTPSGTIWEEATEDSGCRLFTPRVPFCNEPCVGGAICVEDGQCQQYPSPVSVGTVEVEGVRTDSGEISFSMDPIAGNYQSAGIDLAYPAFSEGDEITITAQGDSYTPPFTLKTTGISPLQGLNKSIALEDGQAVTLTWDRPEQTNAAGIHLKLDISHHGGSKGKIECDTEDTGSFVLPAALLDQLKSLGIAGFPTLIVSRESIGSAPISEVGPVDLVIGSTVELPVKIPGLTSCFDDKDCPEGQTCGVDRACH